MVKPQNFSANHFSHGKSSGGMMDLALNSPGETMCTKTSPSSCITQTFCPSGEGNIKTGMSGEALSTRKNAQMFSSFLIMKSEGGMCWRRCSTTTWWCPFPAMFVELDISAGMSFPHLFSLIPSFLEEKSHQKTSHELQQWEKGLCWVEGMAEIICGLVVHGDHEDIG